MMPITTRIHHMYDPFGQQMKESSTIDQPYRFSTKEAQAGTGQYYFGYRTYDSCSGKWTTRDPLGEAGGMNLYGAMNNSAINWVDPNGKLVFFYHYWITVAAALRNGYTLKGSFDLAGKTMFVDYEFYNPGTQGYDCNATRHHAMAGLRPDGRPQPYEEAIKATQGYIYSSMQQNNNEGALHATQDLATPLHAGQLWQGFSVDLISAAHIYGDVYPSLLTIYRAYKDTSEILKGNNNEVNKP